MGSDRIYVLNVADKRKHDEDWVEIPYSDEPMYVLRYAKEHKYPKKRIVAMTPEAFESFRKNVDDNVEFAEIFEYQFGDKVRYVTESEFEFFDNVLSDLCFEMRNEMCSLYNNLRYFHGKKYERLRKSLKALLVKRNSSDAVSVMLMEDIDIDKAFDRIIIKEKGDF